ncbi:coiled-coil domain-containing protein 138-like isoform X1 [Anguilla anguilla]|uniref:coiled-coil domain-containing protein 138-like isoform X1 n=2 Tax=Anguilla anguilla TaxID=7936 RepID=UPI0015B2B944|nr:coiled-coil domain-containing protein 138-like isoform X1 [Anguilla anguilla]
MSSESSETCIDFTVEMLKKKYLNKRKLASKRNVNRGERVGLDNMKCNETRIARTVESPLYGSIDHHRKRYDKALQELFQAVTNVPERLDRVGQWEHSQSLSEDEDEHSAEEAGYTSDTQNNINTETDVTLPSCLAKGSGSGGTGGSAPANRQQKRPSPQGSSLSAADISQVYQEMVHIYEKLQTERTHQQQWATQLQEWEERLRERESRLLRPRQEQEEAHGQVRGLQEQYQQDVQQLSEALKEKARENRRIKASFDSIKELNDTMRNQLNDVTEQNKKLESQSKKVQARLENLQRKYEYSMAHKGRESVLSKTQEPKPSKQDKPSLPAKPSKASTSPSGVKLLVLLLDWVTDCHLVSGQGDGPGQGAQQALPLYTGSIQERCSKVLPMLTEQLQLVPAVDKGLLIPLLKFIYLSLKQLDNSPQQLTLTSTMRRLGEEVYRGSGPQGGAFDAPVSTRTKASPLFKSPCLHTRFLSTLIILSTISQADILAQALDSLHDDLRSEEGRELFLQYRALPVVLAHLRGGGRGLLGVSIDILLQMAGESRLLNSFLEACSTEDFFRCIATLLRNPRLDISLVEKASIILQKLSKIRKNKRLFELCSIHLTVQEMHRTVDPTHAFLAINLNSVLFNLGMMKRTPLCSSPADSP